MPPATFALAAIGLALGSRLLLPLLEGLPAWAVMVALQRQGRRGAALAVMLAWGASLGAAQTALFYRYPDRAASTVIHGPAYADEMVRWVRTAEGEESEPHRFLPKHALHLALYVGLCLATASLLGILMGTVLMGTMACYVATLARLSTRPLLTCAVGWHFYSLLRIVASIILGVLLSEPLLSRVARAPAPGRRKLLYVAAAALLLLDPLCKTWGAEPLRRVLASLIGS